MNKIRSFSVLPRKIYLLFAFLLVAFYACKKDGELSPDFDSSDVSVEFSDTLTVESTVIKEDSFRTDLYNIAMLGIYHDPIFGIKSSSIYTNIGLSGFPTNFGAGFSIDSVVLTLEYAELYGNPNSPMSINVYELSTTLDGNKEYYSSDTAAHDATLLKSVTFTPNLTDSVLTTIDSVLHKPHLRIKLDEPSFITKLEGDTLYNDNTDFNNVFKGLHITTNSTVTNNTLLPEEGSIVSFDMHSSLSTVTVYYNDSLQESFLINSETKKFSHFAHNYTGTDVEEHLNNTVSKDTTVSYVSSMAGVKTKLKIPHLRSLLEGGNVIINKAELVIPIAINTEGNYDTPLSVIGLAGINEIGESVFTPDYFLGYCGCINTSDNTYTFDVTRYIHQLLYETSPFYGMYIVAAGSAVSANRVVFGSAKNTFSLIKLNITYSKL